MKLSISNIGWEKEQDNQMYDLMKQYNFSGLEIAPTRIFPETPYDRVTDAGAWAEKMKRTYGIAISSIQSIWYGKTERLFGSEREWRFLLSYTKEAVDFAAAMRCKNLVFGCPRNRCISHETDLHMGILFFRETGNYAFAKGTTISIEANPPIYHTNYINDTLSAFELVEQVDSQGFKVNLDIGTMIQNRENELELQGRVHLINHIHVSEPGLEAVKNREIHRKVQRILQREKYEGYISIETKKIQNVSLIEHQMAYVRSIFE